MTPSEIIINYLRDHPNCNRGNIEKSCGISTYPVRYALYELIKIGVIGKYQYANNDWRYFIIDESLYKKKNPFTVNEQRAIRSAEKFDQFIHEVTPIISNNPGKSSLFYAEALGKNLQSTVRRLRCMENKDMLFSDTRWRPAPISNKATLWWIKGQEPTDLDNIDVSGEPLRNIKVEKCTKTLYRKVQKNEQFIREILSLREKKLMERLQSENRPMPIPSYAEFFKRQEGRK